MSKVYKKQIFPLGKHLVSDLKGNRHEVDIKKERVLKLINTFNSMRSKGLKVFAPYEHDEESVPVENIDDLLNPKNNGGEWLSFYLEDDVLYGNIKAATDEDAERIGSKVQGCSVYIDDYVDGKGKEWDDAILHVALTNKPVAVTENFSEEGKGLAIAMSTSMSKKEQDPTSYIQAFRDTLKTKLNIEIPETPDVCEFLRMVTGIFKNFNPGAQTTTNLDTPMEIMMSTSTKSRPEELNPDVELWSKRAKKASAIVTQKEDQIKALVKHIGVSYKGVLQTRLDAVKEAFKDDEELLPRVEGLAKSLPELELEFDFEKASLVTPNIESDISILESVAKRVAPEKKEESGAIGSTITQEPPAPQTEGEDMSAETVDSIINGIR